MIGVLKAGCSMWLALLATWIVCDRGNTETLASPTPRETVRYHGIRPTDPGGREGLRNPERGLRIECPIGEAPEARHLGYLAPTFHLKSRAGDGYSDSWWVDDAKYSEKDGVTLILAYHYLDFYTDGPIAEAKLADLDRSFRAMRAAGMKAVFRVAYEKNPEKYKGPTDEMILKHLDQLAPVVQKNKDVIYVMQAGLVGAWGEWHNSTHGIENDHKKLSRIMAKLLEILPPDRMTQVRVPKYKRWVLSEPPIGAFERVTSQNAFNGTPASRIGFHNDGFLANNDCGGTWTEAPYYANPRNPEFDYMTEESPFVPVDGEMFVRDLGGKIDGLRAAVRMRLHHYASFSYAHGYSMREDGNPYSIDDWKTKTLTPTMLSEAKMPISDGYFEDASGNLVARSQFEYIRDHLGYRIELQAARYPTSARAGGKVPVRVDLINRGFATMHNPRPVYLVLLRSGRCLQSVRIPDADPRNWQPHKPGDTEYWPLIHSITGNIKLPEGLEPGKYSIGLWMPDASESLRNDPRYAVRVANRDVDWIVSSSGKQGINVLGRLEIDQGPFTRK